MKTRITLTIAAILLMGSTASSQLNQYAKLTCAREGERTIEPAFFAGMSASHTQVMSRPAAYLGGRAGVVFNDKFSIGLAGYGLWYDYRLNELVSSGTYHLEAGYTGLVLEYVQVLSENTRLNFSLLTGHGIAIYRYDRAYTGTLDWHAEIIDKDTFSVMEPGIELMIRTGDNLWIGASLSYCSTSPIQLQDTQQGLIEGIKTGISFTCLLF